MDTPATIQNIPNELLANIIQLVGTENKRFSIFCRLSLALRNVALNTPGLWNNLSTTCYVDIRPSLVVYVEPWYIEYLTWWSDRVKDGNNFSLTFNVEICIKTKNKRWTKLKNEIKANIFNLVSRARFLKTNGTGLGFLACWFRSETPWPLESIVFSSEPCSRKILDGAPGIEPFLWAFDLPALRKYSVRDRIPCPIHYELELQTWGQLTHIDIKLRTTLSDWRTFIVTLRPLQSARIKMDLCRGDEDDGTKPNDNIQHTIADLEELWLEVSCYWDPPIVGSVLDGIHLPNLKTFIVDSPRLTIDSLHRLLRNKRLVERIRVSAMFPTVTTNTNLLAFPSNGESLMEYAPNLTRLAIAIPDLDNLSGSVTEYVDSMRQSRWLKGRNEPMQTVLPWSTASTQERINNLERHLSLHGIGDVVIKSGWLPYREGSDVSRWDHVVDFESQF
jgi:hypothetical protein